MGTSGILPKDPKLLIEVNVFIKKLLYLFTQPLLHDQDVTQGQFFKRDKQLICI